MIIFIAKEIIELSIPMDTVVHKGFFIKEEIGMIGHRIKVVRRKRGLTQQELAEIIGVTKLTISRWERGERSPNAEMVFAVAKALQTTSSYLLGETDCADGYEKENSFMLRAMRQYLELSLYEAAGILGISPQTLEYLEREESRGSIEDKTLIIKKYGIYMARLDNDSGVYQEKKQNAMDFEVLLKIMASYDPDIVLHLRSLAKNVEEISEEDWEFLANLLKISLKRILKK